MNSVIKKYEWMIVITGLMLIPLASIYLITNVYGIEWNNYSLIKTTITVIIMVLLLFMLLMIYKCRMASELLNKVDSIVDILEHEDDPEPIASSNLNKNVYYSSTIKNIQKNFSNLNIIIAKYLFDNNYKIDKQINDVTTIFNYTNKMIVDDKFSISIKKNRYIDKNIYNKIAFDYNKGFYDDYK